jgi:hypothetical protein
VKNDSNKALEVFFAVALVLLLPARLQCQQPLQKKLQVVIIAVSQFDDTDWQNASLEISIKQSSQDIQKFFRENFPTAKLTVLETHQQTTAKSIQEFFSPHGDFRKLANGTATVLFIISHGKPHTGPVPPLTNDLWVVGSETHPGDARERWVSVAKDVVQQIDDLEPGSVVFLFLDTCYSGSLQSLEMRVNADFAELYGIRMMVMASSLPKERSYRATFSEALIDRWKEPSTGEACTSPWQAPSSLRKYMIQRLEPPPLSLFEGNPQIVIPFFGDFCLESFDKDHGLLVLFNASTETLSALINGDRTAPLPVQTLQVVPHTLRRDKYRLEVFASNTNAPLMEKPLDLNQDPIAFEVLGTPSAAKLGASYLRAASYVTTAGLPNGRAATFEKRAFSSFANGGKWHLAQSALLKLKQSEPRDKDLEQAQLLADPTLDIAYEDRPSQRQETEWRLESETNSGSLATIEKVAGRFDEAAQQYAKAAASSSSANESEELTKEAYFAYGASYQAKKARTLRIAHRLQLDSDCPTCISKESAAVKDENRTLVRLFRIIGPTDFARRPGKDFSSLCVVRSLATVSAITDRVSPNSKP